MVYLWNRGFVGIGNVHGNISRIAFCQFVVFPNHGLHFHGRFVMVAHFTSSNAPTIANCHNVAKKTSTRNGLRTCFWTKCFNIMLVVSVYQAPVQTLPASVGALRRSSCVKIVATTVVPRIGRKFNVFIVNSHILFITAFCFYSHDDFDSFWNFTP